MALQGNDPGAMRQTATGLRYSGAALTGVATAYQSLAAHKNAMASAIASKPADPRTAADVANQVRVLKEQAQRLAARSKDLQQLAGNLFTAAGGLDGTATSQEAASSAAGFAPPLTFPEVPPPASFDLPPGPDPTVDTPGGGPTGVPSPGEGLPGLPGDDSPGLLSPIGGGAGFGGALGGVGAVSTGPDGAADSGDAPSAAGQETNGGVANGGVANGEEASEGVLGLVRGGGAAAGLAVASVVGAGIAASVLRASRRAAKREKDLWEDEERDGDDVEAVYPAGPGRRPPAG